MHAWKFRTSSEKDDEELDELVEAMESADETAEKTYDDACADMIERFQKVHELVRNEAEHRIVKEKGRQKRDFDARHLGSGVKLKVGMY